MPHPSPPAGQNILDAVKALDHEQFAILVRGNLGSNAKPRLWEEALLHPDLIWRTRDILSDTHQAVEGAIATKKSELAAFLGNREAYFKANREFEMWKKTAIAHRRVVQGRMLRVKEVLRDLHGATGRSPKAPPNAPPSPDELAHRPRDNFNSLFELAFAVAEHQRVCKEQMILPEEHDLKLWRRFDEIQVSTTEEGTRSLTEWVEDIMAKPEFEPRPHMR